MKPGAELIEQFFNGTCTAEEAAQVMEWLLENDEVALWQEEWTTAAAQGEYPAAFQSEMLQTIQAKTFAKQARVRRLYWKSAAVAAASVLLVAGAYVWQRNTPAAGSLALNTRTTQTTAKPDWIVHEVPAGKRLQLKLEDGSDITLEAGSVLKYDATAFNTPQRELYLQGNASFKVKASAQHPFSVHTTDFTTTALGTSFAVSAPASGDLRVKLFDGKVLVNSTAQQQQVYLQPGQQLAWQAGLHKLNVSTFVPAALKINAAAKGNGIAISDDYIVFDNTPLKAVLDVLEQQYHTQLHYKERSITKVYFSGKILPATDSLDMILQTIARLNKLTIVATGDGYVIK